MGIYSSRDEGFPVARKRRERRALGTRRADALHASPERLFLLPQRESLVVRVRVRVSESHSVVRFCGKTTPVTHTSKKKKRHACLSVCPSARLRFSNVGRCTAEQIAEALRGACERAAPRELQRRARFARVSLLTKSSRRERERERERESEGDLCPYKTGAVARSEAFGGRESRAVSYRAGVSRAGQTSDTRGRVVSSPKRRARCVFFSATKRANAARLKWAARRWGEGRL